METIHRCSDKFLAHRFFVEQGIGSPATWLPGELPDELPYPGARQGAARLRLAAYLPCHEPRRARLLPRYTTADSMVQAVCSGDEFSIDVFCDLSGRCLAAMPRTMIESKGGESIKGMTIKDERADRVRPQGLGGARDHRPRERPVLPRAGRRARGDGRQPALRRWLSLADGCRLALSRAGAGARERRAARRRGSASFARAS